MLRRLLAVCLGAAALAYGSLVTVNTTSGQLIGSNTDGVISFKGVRFAQAPVGNLRWVPPQPFVSLEVQNATSFAPSCIQQFSSALEEAFFNQGGPSSSSEDCLFLNIWTPTNDSGTPKPVLVWIYGGAFTFGTTALPTYDGTSFAKNQDVVVVSVAYRTNVFGFSMARDLAPQRTNLGLLDQELALQWVQQNIAALGGDPAQVTLMGQSAGGQSVGAAFLRHTDAHAPFRAGILLSGAPTFRSAATNHTPFDAFARAANCSQPAGPARLACLRAVPAAAVSAVLATDAATFAFEAVVDNATWFVQPLARIAARATALKPIVVGNAAGDGTVWALGYSSLRAAITDYLGASAAQVSDAQVRALYPGQNDSVVTASFITDYDYKCGAGLWAKAFVGAGERDVFRYSYGAVFVDLSPLPGLGAWHGSELPMIFGTYNASSATAAEKTLSATLQGALGAFVRDPTAAPAAHWARYAGNATRGLAELGYHGNVGPGDFVEAVPGESLDGPCAALYDRFLAAGA
ncbi:carboxylic ester hydrolase [Phanerochaete sordida]|uniref:Carboxylic ester hydrolase n=1 Tax=Phanerochaete sordida TaxID=48140 RepID=A0A9P3G6H0_9APHY|nr:carboxylic ester hydrolase [Phanerochaete sordida]